MSEQFPRGQINESDEGAMTMGIAHDPKTNTLILNFFKPIVWFGLGPGEVIPFLTNVAKHASRMLGVEITVQIDSTERNQDERSQN